MAPRHAGRITALAAAAVLAISGTATAQTAGSYQRVSGSSNPALEFYGGSAALAFAPQPTVRPLPVVPPADAPDPARKPFSSLRPGPNLSPYLALDIRESSTSLPNYYAFVRPQLEQQQFEQQQQRQNQRLQQQVRSASEMVGATRGVNNGVPGTGHSTHYFNMGGYYPGAATAK